ncbi:MAG: hypothetical protein RXR74_04820, partial [Nitrososphaeria archaeon]
MVPSRSTERTLMPLDAAGSPTCPQMVGLLLNVGGVERSHGPRGNGLRYLKPIDEPKSEGSPPPDPQ